MKTYKKQDKTSKVISGEITHSNSFAADLLYIRHKQN